ncbi:hypothetical protein [Bacillus cereus]|uniref:hypothetical protein n=1 Tax=Bacillus cereus TaxID=1396 RepID=UPI000BEB4266|nr:hypothetical protein [Bacillus cereus]PEE36706.1 hypothetical protein CON59_10730 [Bacillus cereus]PET44400.1 hypothetical protein CN523_19240 [Bacillus cereus]PEV74253.1 hypothetical protein CN429_24965 [Bacillus cereus]PFD54587.1 hypothetical protein CN271_32380 [Bacillus cereus]PFE69209.1 hypothetical protein CN319_22860 [Bacillus cereus]
MEHIAQLPITLNEAGDLVIKRTDDKTIEKLLALVQTQFANQNNKLTKVDQNIGKLGESVESFDNRLTQTQLENVASKIVRDQLQQERHAKAKGFVGNKVQLTFEAMEGTKSDLERHVQVLIKKEVTRVMRHITSYLKEQLGLKSIDDIPNCLVEKHKTLLKELTWKKLDTFMKKGIR